MATTAAETTAAVTAPAAASTAPPPSAAPAATTTTNPPTTTTTTTVPPPMSITRPIADPAVCDSISATGGEPSGLPRDPSSGLPLTLFARPSEWPVPIQVIGDPVDGQAEPFALVQRFFDRGNDARPQQIESINDIDIAVGVHANGNGEAEWTLPDGSIGYLRSRGLDREQLIAILERLTPRAIDAPNPGFDYGPDGPDGLSLVVDAMNTDERWGDGAGSQCRVPSSDLVYRIWRTTGPDMFTYASVINRAPPIDVGVVGDSVIIISGFADPLAPSVDDVIDADPEIWRQLLIAAEPPLGLPQPISTTAGLSVDFVPIGDLSTPVGSIGLRIDVQDGVAFLEVDTTNATVGGAAEYWKTEVDARIRSRSTAHPGSGGLMGVRLGNSSLPDRYPDGFTVRISTTDGDDQTIQTTGEIWLMPI